MKFFAIALLTTSLVAGCSGTNQETGTVLGGALGIALGSMIGDGNGRTAAMVLGGIFGASIGNNIGSKLDERDRLLMTRNTQNALEYGRSDVTSTWENPDSGHSGTVTPAQAYKKNSRHCRKFSQTIYIDGKREIGQGEACRSSDGKWMIQ